MSGITFDPTINLSAVISTLGLAGFCFGAVLKMRDFARDTNRDMHELKADFASVKTAVDEIKQIQWRLSDGKERMDAMSERIRKLEADREPEHHRKI